MRSYPVHEAKARLSQLLRDVEAGEDVVITRAGTPVVRLTAVSRGGGTAEDHGFGSLAGQIRIADDFDTPLSEEELEDWYRGPIEPPES